MDARPQPDYRVGEPRDAAALAAVALEAFATYCDWAPDAWSPAGKPGAHEAELLGERLALPGYWCLFGEFEGQPVAYVVLRPAVTTGDNPEPIRGLGHLWHLFVRSAWWGSGVATRLLAEAMEEARRRDYTGARLWTPRDNARARAFYEREGWHATGAEHYSADLDLQLLEYRRPLDR
jgi:GNAT superfamily N-acetyltransferase